jgi:hypothetical protein
MKFDKSVISEWLLGALIVVALVLLTNPFNLLMTSAFLLTLLMLLGTIMIAFAVFVWREQPRDEREALYSFQAGRNAYLVGSGVLVLAIIVESLQHKLDPWLSATLGAIVLTKLVFSIWSRHR